VRRHAHVLDALAAGELTIGSWRDHGTHVVLLTGELDVATVHRVEDELRAIEATDVEQIILDLSGLTFMDSSGVHLIARACMINSTRLRLRPGPPHVQRVLALAGADAPPLAPRPRCAPSAPANAPWRPSAWITAGVGRGVGADTGDLL